MEGTARVGSVLPHPARSRFSALEGEAVTCSRIRTLATCLPSLRLAVGQRGACPVCVR